MLKSSFTTPNRRYRHSNDAQDAFFTFGLMEKTRVFYLGDVTYAADGASSGIDSAAAEYVIKGLHILNSRNSRPIRLIMNSPGGSVSDGLAIYDAIRSSESPVDIEVLGAAFSMASIILQAGRVRMLHPNAAFMMHEGTMDLGSMTARAQQAWAAWSQKDNELMYQIYAKRSGRPIKFWEKVCLQKHDVIYSASETVKLGLADKVLEAAPWTEKIVKSKR